ncbi:hypothetical protein SOASR030_10540 [Leminorella grimontii]|uniref:Regulator of competence-specific genes n=1 Tax=Leminorella grimontii TaxID=82981 RepID=A0AAV5N2P6_9GAMM|nr:TfoX/Sxy family DNA transformation protein [Leminorella grimontii]KFC95879.1 DNA transformation protein [Leminorella grimontii ATCC 33999 = DSM 5078]GKX54942.1 hypothetical protein SOASR030_10540 [Leminorella grimontii]GKX61251.1 hypothetical protein SOASR031_35660 [Leminorella grimontii]VFS58049.1 Regulator of competence-specific genes [Leminorella grimontii]
MKREVMRQYVKEIIAHFSDFGELSSQSMFGGYGICKDNVMFALVSEGKFYLRANSKLESTFINQGMEQYIYHKKGVPVFMKYYHVHQALWQNEERLRSFLSCAFVAAMMDSKKKNAPKCTRLKDLPNLTLATERLLWLVNVESIEDLIKVGALETFIKIREIRKDVKTELLFSLAGAILGCHAAALPSEVRQALLDGLSQHDALEEEAFPHHK